MISRRTFIGQTSLGGAALLLASRARADAPMLSDSDPMAKQLQYTADAAKAGKPKGTQCSTCQLYQGKSGAASGPCAIFAGKQVHAAGWCVSYTKKAA